MIFKASRTDDVVTQNQSFDSLDPMVKIDSACSAAYEDVRNDKSETNWLLMGYPVL